MAHILEVGEALDFLRSTLAYNAESAGSTGHAIRVFGSPRSGKTQLALSLITDESVLPLVRSGRAILLASHRKEADRLNAIVLERAGASSQERPVKTISALAFSLLEDDRARRGCVPPKLMDGAEQDRIITEILDEHLEHMKRGDDCQTCDLFRAYLAVGRAHPTGLPRAVTDQADQDSQQTSDQIFQRVITPQFVAQIRDIFARLDELDLSGDGEPASRMKQIEADPRIGDAVWTCEAWDLALALKNEYGKKIDQDSSVVQRLDPAALLVQARGVLSRVECPELVVMDDCQDLTLAGFELLLALKKAGTDVVLIGCDDESVQGFRGAAPEVCTALEMSPSVMGAQECELADHLDSGAPTYRATVCQRISDVIGSAIVSSTVPVPERPGKLRMSNSNSADNAHGGSLEARIFKTSQEETDDLACSIARAALKLRANHASDIYSSMAVIAHDNSTLRSVGRKLESAGIPVSYVSSTIALKQSPVVQELLGMLQLVQFVRSQSGHDLDTQTSESIMELLLSTVSGPLFPVLLESGAERPARVSKIVSGFTAVSRLSSIHEATGHFGEICSQWAQLTGSSQTQQTQPVPPQGIALLLLIGSDSVRRTLAHLLDAVMLTRREKAQSEQDEERQDDAQSDNDSQDSVGDLDLSVLLRCCEIIRSVAQKDNSASSLISAPYSQLWNIWDACNVSDRWADQALGFGPSAQLANQRLDTVIRLFAHAQNAPIDQSVDEFIDRIQNLDIEADSLARQAPKDETVTLTTPAGALMLHKKYVWVIGVQDGVWPFLAPRDSLFGTQTLTLIALAQRLEADGIDSAIGSTRQDLVVAQNTALEYSEEQSFLVALTRASTRTVVSAVWSDDVLPSPFLSLFMPELVSRDQRNYATVGSKQPSDGSTNESTDGSAHEMTDDQLSSLLSGHDTSLQGMAVACRTILARQLASDQSDETKRDIHDASAALAFLASRGIREANPNSWGFIDHDLPDHAAQSHVSVPATASESPTSANRIPTVYLSPSNVDSIWKCPLRWSMEKRFGGPSISRASMQFGTLVHETLQWAADEKYDRTVDDQQKLTDMLVNHAREAIKQQPHFRDIEDAYGLHRRASGLRTLFSHAAHYFIASRNPLYPAEIAKNAVPASGELTGVGAEVPFSFSISLSTLEKIIRQTPGINAVSAAELYSVLSDIAGGFSAHYDPRTRIVLSARIDRLEKRSKDGQTLLDIIDWKTGAKPTNNDRFSDLQLICYQLGVTLGDACKAAFPGQDMSQAQVDRAVLFHLAEEADPQSSYYPETVYQPALLTRGEKSGGWQLTTQFRARPHYGSLSRLFDIPHTRKDDKLTESMHGSREQALWGLSMFARLIYAASYSRSSFYPAKRDATYCSSCPFKPICPAWQDSDTIYGPLSVSQEEM
jgi:superfamily I DNA/RNA helicase